MKKDLVKKIAILVTLQMYTGCITGGSEPTATPVPVPTPALPTPPLLGPVVAPTEGATPVLNVYETPLPDYAPGPVSRPAQRLLDKASEEWKRQRREQALALLDRAFRIDNQSTEISLRHSQYYFEMGQYLKAENWAKRAMGNSDITPEQRNRAWQLMARTRYKLGDLEGAQKALKEAQI
ncbi:MAG: hypothetical protein WCI18_15685 [Pseudomonadota bacterium]